MKNFLQQLRVTYGDISIESILAQESDKIPTTPINNQISDTSPTIDEPILFDPFDVPPPIITKPKEVPPPIRINIPVISPLKSFSPVNISTSKDWAEFREEVLDMHELTNFLAGKMDSQSPIFRNILDTYQNALKKSLSMPQEIDAESSNTFVSELAQVIKERFLTILRSYQKGLQGKASQPTEYYRQLEIRVKQYFKRIGLKSDNVKCRSDFRLYTERMKPIPMPVQNKILSGKIAEVLIQPHFFEYHDYDGEVRKKWIDGECIVYKC